jgi:glycine betaine/choline ABC-type transport system substrate-binding protein
MKKVFFTFLITFTFFTTPLHACVGKILSIGILNSVDENILAELVSVLINERTGTAVNIKVYGDSEEIYDAVKKDEIGIVIENTQRALKILNISGEADRAKAYDVSKEEFRNRFNLIWLKPFGTVNREDGEEQYYYAPVITEYVLKFPALPRLISKLADIAADRNFRELINRSGWRKPKSVRI